MSRLEIAIATAIAVWAITVPIVGDLVDRVGRLERRIRVLEDELEERRRIPWKRG